MKPTFRCAAFVMFAFWLVLMSGCGGGGGNPITPGDTPQVTAVNPGSGGAFDFVKFTATTKGPVATSWAWQFGDAATPSTANSAEPEVMLAKEGSYSCSVQVSNAKGSSKYDFTLTVGVRALHESEFKNNVIKLDPALVHVTSTTDTDITLTGSVPPLQPGQIIISTEGEGALRKVVSVDQSGQEYVVQTTQATIEEAFDGLDVYIRKELGYDQVASFEPLLDGVTFEKGDPIDNGGSAYRQGEGQVGSIKINLDCWVGPMRLQGSSSLVINALTDLRVGYNPFDPSSFGRLQHFLWESSLASQTQVKISGALKGSFPLTKIGEMEFLPIKVGYVVFVPRITVAATLTATGEIGIVIEKTIESTAFAGMEYYPSTGWITYSGHHETVSDTGPTLSQYAAFEARIDLPLHRFELLIYGVVGPYFETGLPTVWFRGETLSNPPTFKVTGDVGMFSSIGAEFGLDFPVIGWIKILDYKVQGIIQIRIPFASWSFPLGDNKKDPVAIANINKSQVQVNEPIHFTGAGSWDPDGGPITNYEWDWDNNGTFDAQGYQLDHSYNKQGAYHVQLRVTDDEGKQAWLATPLLITVNSVTNQPPVALATAGPNPQTAGLPITFQDNGSYDPDGNISNREWDWDNNGTFDQIGISAQHTWTVPGYYTVQFRVTDNGGLTAVLPSPLGINISSSANLPPVAQAKYSPIPGITGQIVTLSDNGSYDPDGSITNREWDLDNDGDYDASGPAVDNSWPVSGYYTVQFRVTDNEGQTAKLPSPLEIYITKPPIAQAKYSPDPGIAGQPVTFSDNGSYELDPGGYITNYEWDWENDGVYDTGGSSVDHTWATAGTYYVQFRVTDDLGATGVLSQPLQVTIQGGVSDGWARTWGGLGDDVGYGVAVDAVGNLYVTGSFISTIDFDPGTGTDTHTSVGGGDVFLSKFDSNGNFIWARTWGGEDDDDGIAVIVDASGNAYVTGGFQSTMDFDPGGGVDSHESFGAGDIFLSKFGPSGNFIMALTWGGVATDVGSGVAVDTSGNVYVIGDFQGTVDFDPSLSGDNHTSTGGVDVFLSKFDSTGEFIWACTWGGMETETPWGFTVDASGNPYVTGYFMDTVDFNPGGGVDYHTAVGATDAFLSKFDPNGNFVWARTWGGLGGGQGNVGNGVAIDASGNPYVTGRFEGTGDFDPGTSVDNHTSTGGADVFLSKFDSSGEFIWASTWGGTSNDWGNGIAVNSSGDPFVVGWFRSAVDFDPGGGVDNHTSVGGSDVFLSKFDSNGNFIWARAWGGPTSDQGQSVAIDISGYPYVTGLFTGTVDFDPASGADEHTSNGLNDAFLSKFMPDGSW